MLEEKMLREFDVIDTMYHTFPGTMTMCCALKVRNGAVFVGVYHWPYDSWCNDETLKEKARSRAESEISQAKRLIEQHMIYEASIPD